MHASLECCCLLLCLTRTEVQCRLQDWKKTPQKKLMAQLTLLGAHCLVWLRTTSAWPQLICLSCTLPKGAPASAAQQCKPRLRVTLRREVGFFLVWINWKHKTCLPFFFKWAFYIIMRLLFSLMHVSSDRQPNYHCNCYFHIHARQSAECLLNWNIRGTSLWIASNNLQQCCVILKYALFYWYRQHKPV